MEAYQAGTGSAAPLICWACMLVLQLPGHWCAVCLAATTAQLMQQMCSRRFTSSCKCCCLQSPSPLLLTWSCLHPAARKVAWWAQAATATPSRTWAAYWLRQCMIWSTQVSSGACLATQHASLCQPACLHSVPVEAARPAAPQSLSLWPAAATGLTNDFLMATGAPLAVLYNDRSPEENHVCGLG
jgi:hypothetical protein